MERYRRKTALASAADRALRLLTAWAAGAGWFVALWGLSLPALTAGTALGGLFWLCARLLGKKRVQKKEAALRRVIGGELALERLLLLSPEERLRECLQWLAPKATVRVETTMGTDAVGTWKGQRTLVRAIVQHPGTEIHSQQISETLRAARLFQAQKTLLCVSAPLAREALRLTEEEESLRLIQREELILLAGEQTPATDEDLCRLKRKRPPKRSPAEWLRVALHPSRAKRYFWYGIGMAALALLTRQGFYPLPAALCLLLFAGCKIYERKRGRAGW